MLAQFRIDSKKCEIACFSIYFAKHELSIKKNCNYFGFIAILRRLKRTMDQFISAFSGYFIPQCTAWSINFPISNVSWYSFSALPKFHCGFCGDGKWFIALHALHTKFDLLNIFNYSNQKSNIIVARADELRSHYWICVPCCVLHPFVWCRSSALDINGYACISMWWSVCMLRLNVQRCSIHHHPLLICIACNVNKWKIIGFESLSTTHHIPAI